MDVLLRHRLVRRVICVVNSETNDFFICKAEEWGVAVATAIDDNAADEKSDKSI